MRKKRHLEKQLGFWDVFSFAAGSMISSGIFVLPAILFFDVGSYLPLAYLLAGLVVLPTLLAKIEMTTALPISGGSYFFTERILGTYGGVLVGFLNWLSISLKSAFALLGMGLFIQLLFPSMGPQVWRGLMLLAVIFFTVLNLFSVKSSGYLQLFLTLFLVAMMGIFVLLGYREFSYSLFYSSLEWRPFSFWVAVGTIFVSYGGITKVSSLAEEIKDLRRSLIGGLFFAFVTVQTLYILVAFILVGVLSPADFLHSQAPLYEAALVFGKGRSWSIFLADAMALAALVAFFTTANAGLLSASRSLFSMSRDGLLPHFFERLNKAKVPYWSLLFTASLMACVILFFEVVSLAKLASFFMLLVYIVDNIALLVIRYARLNNYRPLFKVPFFPFLPIVGLLLYVIFALGLGLSTILWGFAALVVMSLWYFGYVRPRIQLARTSALVHMIQRSLGRDLLLDQQDNVLEQELFSIVQERENLIEDDFDQILSDAPLLYFPHLGPQRVELFARVADELAEHFPQIDKQMIREKLSYRERQSSTILYPGVAVPHAVLPEESPIKFTMIVAFSSEGFLWDAGNRVNLVFILLGRVSERQRHLKTLMAIGQILQDQSFIDDLGALQNERHLRSILRLSRRRRQEE